jgi:two-component system, chemotaxis family, response regulator Rcp1
MRIIHILLVEDNPGDIRLTQEALKDGKIANTLYVVNDGVEALDYLRKKSPYTDAVTPDLVLLDLNIPKKNGMEVLADIKSDPMLKNIPVVILTSSSSEQDVLQTYEYHANCYITKPVDFEQFINAIKLIDDFWLSVVRFSGNEQV